MNYFSVIDQNKQINSIDSVNSDEKKSPLVSTEMVRQLEFDGIDLYNHLFKTNIMNVEQVISVFRIWFENFNNIRLNFVRRRKHGLSLSHKKYKSNPRQVEHDKSPLEYP